MEADIPVAGEPVAEPRLATLFRTHATEAERLAYLLCGDRALAEDAVQEAFVRLAGRFRDVREPDLFPEYLRKTVINVLRTHYRRGRIHRSWLDRRVRERASTDSIPDVETRDEIMRALQELPERQRAALVLRYYVDLSLAQTAETMGCREGTVKSLTSRALHALQETLGGDHQ